MEHIDKEFAMEFAEWAIDNCEIIKTGDPWGQDIYRNWFFYKGKQMTGYELVNIYLEQV